MEFDMLRGEAEARMVTNSGFPGEFASAPCMRTAALSEHDKSLDVASFRITLASTEASSQMRRLSGPRGIAA